MPSKEEDKRIMGVYILRRQPGVSGDRFRCVSGGVRSEL